MVEWIKVAIDFVALVFSIGAILFAWWRTREATSDKWRAQHEASLDVEREERRKGDEKERGARRDALENMRESTSKTHGELKDRLVKVEEQVRHLPTIEHHGELHRDLNKLEARFGVVEEKVDAVTAGTRRIEDFLRKPGGEKSK